MFAIEGSSKMSETQSTKLAIKYNTTVTNDPCAICGDRCDPSGGPDLFLAGTAALVCEYHCGREYAPELMAKLDAWRDSDMGKVYDNGHGAQGEWDSAVEAMKSHFGWDSRRGWSE
jgi:hypothetical protein